MQFMKEAQFMNITFLAILSRAVAVPVLATVIVPLTDMYASQ